MTIFQGFLIYLSIERYCIPKKPTSNLFEVIVTYKMGVV